MLSKKLEKSIEYNIIREKFWDGSIGEWHVPNAWWQMILYFFEE